jgi:hypothetical protein
VASVGPAIGAAVQRIDLSRLHPHLVDCLDLVVQEHWDKLPLASQRRELEEAQATLAWQRGPGKLWHQFVENDLATQAGVLRHYQRQLLGKTLSAREMIDYLCAEHGLTRPQALGLTMPQAIEILRAACLPQPEIQAEDSQYVDLYQIASKVHRTKRSLHRLLARKANPMPPADIEGGGGKKNYWIWSKIRPWLQVEFNMTLPSKYAMHHG